MIQGLADSKKRLFAKRKEVAKDWSCTKNEKRGLKGGRRRTRRERQRKKQTVGALSQKTSRWVRKSRYRFAEGGSV